MLRLRPLVMMAILCPILIATGCASKNEGKIVGKWKLVGGKDFDKQKADMEKMKAYLYMDFKPDNTIKVGVEFTDPNMQKMMGPAMDKAASFSAKYKLLMGEKVEINDLPKDKPGLFNGKDRAQTNISIDGNKMKMTDPDGSTYMLEKI